MTDPWIPMAQRVLTGEFDKSEKSVLQSLFIGMRRNGHPDCLKAVRMIERNKNFSKVPDFMAQEERR